MQYINQQDYEYIKNKYPSTRFSRKDEAFSCESGMAPNDIICGIMKNDESYAELSHPVRKARAIEYVLKNTRISCDERDIFPTINMIDRPIGKTVVKAWRKEFLKRRFPKFRQSEVNWSVTAS